MFPLRFDSFIEEIALSPTYLLGFFIVVLVALDLILVRWIKLDDLNWKRVDYIWLSTALLGILASSSDGGRVLSTRYLDNFEKPQTEFAFRMLRNYLNEGVGVCKVSIRSEYSPPDFDAITAEQEMLCKKAQKIATALPSTLPKPAPALEEMGFESFSQEVKYSSAFVNQVSEYANRYREHQLHYTLLESTINDTDDFGVFHFIGPLLLSLALALRMAKVTGEITNTRKRSK